jgi:hypothetical protein
MNKGLPQLKEYSVTNGQVKMIKHYLSLTTTGGYIKEVLKEIISRGTYNETSKSILNGLRNNYMETVYSDSGMIKYYVVIDGDNSVNPIQVSESILTATEISEDYNIIYATNPDEARDLFITSMKQWDE